VAFLALLALFALFTLLVVAIFLVILAALAALAVFVIFASSTVLTVLNNLVVFACLARFVKLDKTPPIASLSLARCTAPAMHSFRNYAYVPSSASSHFFNDTLPSPSAFTLSTNTFSGPNTLLRFVIF
jgi:hypothetical protein